MFLRLCGADVVLFVVAYVADPRSTERHIPGFGDGRTPATSSSGFTRGGAPAHRRRRDPLGQEAHARRRRSSRSATRLGLDARRPRERPSTPSSTARQSPGFAQRPLIRRTLHRRPGAVPDPACDARHAAATSGPPAPRTRLRETIWAAGLAHRHRRHLPADQARRTSRRRPHLGRARATCPRSRRRRATSTPAAKAAIILVRMDPRGDPCPSRATTGTTRGILAFSKICTHVGCPIALYEQRTHHLLCPCHQSTFDLADAGNVVFGPAAAGCRSCRSTVDRRGILGRAGSDFAEPVGPSFWERGRRMSAVGESRQARRRPGSTSALAASNVPQAEPGQGLPRPLVVHARRDRPVQLHRPAAVRRLPDLLLQAVDDRDRLRRLVRAAAGHQDVRGVRLHAGHLLRHPRRPAHAPGPPLGGAVLRRRDRRAHVPGVLHRGVPQAARDQLGHRRRPAHAGSARGFSGYSLPDDLLSGTGLRIAAASCSRSRWSAPT